MSNFTIVFAHPWLLLVLIPALAVALIPYFRLNKKFRRTRNRVISVVLHIICVTLFVLVLSGMTFTYDVPKEGNEVIVLVDVSASEDEVAQKRDEFVNTLIEKCRGNGMSAGVVTFGFDQVYAVELTSDLASAYSDYKSAPLPDVSASDIASAINYARTLFNNADTGKIVLVTDGRETDGNARTAIRSVLNQKTKIDLVDISSDFTKNDVQISEIIFPDYHVKLNETCVVRAIVQSTVTAKADLLLSDNGVLVAKVRADLVVGDNEVQFNVSFKEEGLHEVSVEVSAEAADNSIVKNDVYTSFYELLNFNKILVLEAYAGESANLEELLTKDERYELTVLNLYTSADIPSTVDELREYDQVILNNVSNADMNSARNPNVPDDFVSVLEEYVSVYGGGMLTVGGLDPDGETAHAYNRADMYNSQYQRMLPVEAINYTPPLGVVVIIDFSGSMNADAEYGATRLHWAKVGADICLNALTERDYFGLMTLYDSNDRYYDVILPMTARTQDAYIRGAIYSIPDEATGGGTTFSYSIERAGQMLRSLTQVEKRRIIIVTDGLPNAADEERYKSVIEDFYEKDGTSISVVVIGTTSGLSKMQDMVDLCKDADGNTVGKVYALSDDEASDIGKNMRDDLRSKELKEVNFTGYSYTPVIKNLMSPLVADLDKTGNRLNVSLEGYFGVKARSNADTVLAGDYEVPLYSQWKLGNGMVGSFMTDLKGVWSGDFMESETGQKFIFNAIDNLMPVSSIRPIDMNVSFVEDNYTNTINVFDALGDGEWISATITDLSVADGKPVSLSVPPPPTEPSDSSDPSESGGEDAEIDPNVFVRSAFNAETGYTNCVFIVKKSGVYLIAVSRMDEEGNELARYEFYKSFAYSKEYDVYFDANVASGKEKLSTLAGAVGSPLIDDEETISDPQVVFEDFVLKMNVVYDPRYLFIIIAIVSFLLDIAVRKFKFKWIHEIVKERKEKKAEALKKNRLK